MASLPPPEVTYEVRPQPKGVLAIEAIFQGIAAKRIRLPLAVAPFVGDARYFDGQDWIPAPVNSGAWQLAGCVRKACRFRYRFQLDAATAGGDDIWRAAQLGELRVIAFSRFLARPDTLTEEGGVRVRFFPAENIGLATGVFPEPGEKAGTYRFRASRFEDIPFAVFGSLQREELEAGGGSVEIVWQKAANAVGTEALTGWVRSAMQSVVAYYGRFPVPHVLVFLGSRDGVGLVHGQTFGEDGAVITGWLGKQTQPKDLRQDWVLTHEMVHLALPDLEPTHHWLEEGIATYVEPFARLRIGWLDVHKVWRDMVDGMPNGLPAGEDRGLDHDSTWGRTYWGGALYCLNADIEIRRRTGNRKGLPDALRAILDEGGSIAVHWPISRVLATGDRAVGVPVLSDLYAKLKGSPAPVDLDEIWKKLGVKAAGDGVEFDPQAPWAGIREAINGTGKN